MADFVVQPEPHWCTSCIRWCPGHRPDGLCLLAQRPGEPPAVVPPETLALPPLPPAPVKGVVLYAPIDAMAAARRALGAVRETPDPFGEPTEPPVERPALVQCRRCHTKTLPRIAAAEWAPYQGVCDICRMPRAERQQLRESIRRAKQHVGGVAVPTRRARRA